MPQGNESGSLLFLALPLALIGFMFWSQRRRQKQAQMLQSSITVGDEVCTTSGLFGRVTALSDTTATLEVAPGTEVRFDRRAVATRIGSTASEAGAGPGTGTGPGNATATGAGSGAGPVTPTDAA